MNALVRYSPGELEAMDLKDRVALEPVLGELRDLIVKLNDDEITKLVAADVSTNTLAEMAGLTRQGMVKRLDRLGLKTAGQKAAAAAKGQPVAPPVPQNGDGPAEVVDGEVVEDDPNDRPARHLPDEVAPDAEENLRTQTLRWFNQGYRLKELLDEGAVIEPRSRDDKAAIKREATNMAAVARRLKGAF